MYEEKEEKKRNQRGAEVHERRMQEKKRLQKFQDKRRTKVKI